MCTLALYFRKFKDYPLIVAANRDEFFSRPSASPQVLVGEPLVFGGKDLLAGGTWLGVNAYGLLAGILNRRSGAQNDKAQCKSRGFLCLEVLRTRDPIQAFEFLTQEKASTYQPFNLLFANAQEAYVAYNTKERIECVGLGKGVHVLSNASIYEPPSGKMDYAHRLFSDAGDQLARGIPDSSFNSCLFKGILGNHRLREGSRDPRDAICVHTSNYGTVSSTVIFYAGNEKRFHYYHASGAPCRSDYERFPSVEVL